MAVLLHPVQRIVYNNVRRTLELCVFDDCSSLSWLTAERVKSFRSNSRYRKINAPYYFRGNLICCNPSCLE